jgi:hypothetical protein
MMFVWRHPDLNYTGCFRVMRPTLTNLQSEIANFSQFTAISGEEKKSLKYY